MSRTNVFLLICLFAFVNSFLGIKPETCFQSAYFGGMGLFTHWLINKTLEAFK